MRTIQTKPDYIKIDLIVNTLFCLDTRFALTLIFNYPVNSYSTSYLCTVYSDVYENHTGVRKLWSCREISPVTLTETNEF